MKKVVLAFLIIGILGINTSLAYFTDKAETKANLTIQLGTLNTKIVEPINIEGLITDNSKADQFIIKNTGTLKQRLTFSLANEINIEKDGLDKLNYEIVFKKSNGETSKVYKGIMTDLFTSSIRIENEVGEDLILDKEETLVGTLTVKIHKEIPYKYSNRELNFDMVVEAGQDNLLFTSQSVEHNNKVSIGELKPEEGQLEL